MATTSLQSLHQPFLHRRHSFPLSEPPSPFPLKPTYTLQNLTLTLSTPISPLTPSSLLTPAAAAATSSAFDALARHLSSGDFRQADEETRRLLIVLAGDAAQQRGYVFFSEVRFISADDLEAIDELWRRHSGGRFGYSVQKRIWEKKARDFTSFFVRVGWMKKLDTEVKQYNYRWFPTEFIWELNDDTPEGHLPLTNALRGTQLLASILTHPAFDGGEEEEGEVEEVKEGGGEKKTSEEGRERPKFPGRSLKPDYSF